MWDELDYLIIDLPSVTGDSGGPLMISSPDSETANIFLDIATKIEKKNRDS